MKLDAAQSMISRYYKPVEAMESILQFRSRVVGT